MQNSDHLDESETKVRDALASLPFDTMPGEIVRAIRLARGLTLNEVATRVGNKTHFTTIAKLETGKTKLTFEWAQIIAEALSVPSNAFFMPYDAFKTTSRIPVYTSINEACSFPDGVAESHDSYYGDGKAIFGFFMLGQPDLYSETNFTIAVIDSERISMAHGCAYLIRDPSLNEGIVGIYRSDLGVERIIPWPAGGATPFFVTPHTVALGEVIELRRQLISRNR